MRYLGLESVVRWPPPMERDTLYRESLRHDVVVDQFAIGHWGATCLEAMSHGRPVLVHATPGTEGISHGEPMPVLKAATEEEIAGAMRRAHRDRQWLADIGRAARAFVAKHHSWDRVTRLLLQAHSEVIA
ncbi:glycosyltransferase [Candidatus Latescibacterota bacterium]